MWQPEPGWAPLPGGRGVLTEGVWTATVDGQQWVVKRTRKPGPGDLIAFDRPSDPSYWRREAEVALSTWQPRGLVLPRARRVDEDDEGFVLWTARIRPKPVSALFAAKALAVFAIGPSPAVPWLARHLLAERIARSEGRGGWPTLARTSMADLADLVWSRRRGYLARYDGLAGYLTHGDLAPGNLVAPSGEEVITVDWGSVGIAPIGTDLGYLALSSREDFEVLLEIHLSALAGLGLPVDRAQVRFAAELVAVYTAFARAEWALTRVARGEGALAGKLRHPAVRPYLRAVERLLPQIEDLLG